MTRGPGSNVRALPTRLNVDQAWTEYSALAKRWASDPDYMQDHAFNMAVARAWERWRDLFLSTGGRA